MEIEKFEKLESMVKTVYKQENADKACTMNDKTIYRWYMTSRIDSNVYRALRALNTVYFGIYKMSELKED